MKRIIGILTLLSVMLLSLGVPMPAASQAGTMISVIPPSITLDPGETTTVNIQIDLAEGEELVAFDVEVKIDPERISAANLTEGDYLNYFIPAPTNEIDNESGVISFGFAQGPDDEPVSGSGTLFSFDIQAKDFPGQTSLEILEVELVGEDYLTIDDYQVINGIVMIRGEVENPYDIYLPLILR